MNITQQTTRAAAEYEESRDGAINRLRTFPRSSLNLFHKPRTFSKKTMCSGIKQRRLETKRSKDYIFPITLLPDDILVNIFILAARTLEDKVALSPVCRRFRGVMMSIRKMWDGYWVESNQTPEQIITIAEGNRPVALKARINLPCDLPLDVETWIDEHGFDLEEYTLRYYKFSVGLILSLGPEELEFVSLIGSDWAFIEPILAGGNVHNLRRLVIRSPQNSSSVRVVEKWRMPVLQYLEVDFVLGTAVARNLVWCSLHDIEEDQFVSLREFLEAANSLQGLDLFLSSRNTLRFHEFCDLPSLRSLAVNFAPYPSLTTHLVRFRLMCWFVVISLSRLLDFLSSAEMLQELAIHGVSGFSGDPGTVDVLPVVTMPSIVSCLFPEYSMGPTLVAKLHMPMLRTLKIDLHALDKLSTITRNEFRTSLQSMSSLEDLELKNGGVVVDDIDEIVRYAPLHLESFPLKESHWITIHRTSWNTSPAPRRELIHFVACAIMPDPMLTLIDYLRSIGLGRMKLQFSMCEGWRTGTFGLDDVMSARIGT